ncbi:MAG TPA: alpha/beta hydrolase [Streptosporangiaceae bacterium]
MQTMLTVGADKIWAEDSGGSGPTLVLLHEGIGDSRMWDPVWPQLTAAFRTIRYDVRGYGRSPAPTENYGLLADLLAVLDHFEIGSAHVVGCSMGGGTALDLALAEPHRVRSLVLLCPGIGGYDWPEEPEVAAEFEALPPGDEDAAADLIVRMWAAAGPDPLVTELARSAARAWPGEQQFHQEDQPAFGRLDQIGVPSIIMVGDKDRAPLIESNEQAAKLIPGCRLIMMPGVDHYPTVREPQLIADTILAFSKDAG